MALQNGMLVKHAKLGLGKIVGLEEFAVHVVFPQQDARLATKLRLPLALDFLEPTTETNAWLSALSGFVLDQATGRYSRVTTWLSHPEALERFTHAYPQGFADPAYLNPSGKSDRQARWRKAGAEYAETLGNGEAEKLLEAGDVRGLVERALKVERIVRALYREDETPALETRLEDPRRAKGYFEALLPFVAAARPMRARFEALTAAVAALAPEAPAESGWPTVTLLPFVARPDLHMLLRPRFARDIAQRLGLELAYDAEPGWEAYSSWLKASGELLEKLKPLGARDFVDVDAFMQLSMTKVAKPRAAASAKPKRKASAPPAR